ncbi:hypothetical protein [Bacillus subtilis]|uniref:hypothetical protein n=1 Tax=Bacillus subtilis TaxID=1423 RepID=UPI0031F504CF
MLLQATKIHEVIIIFEPCLDKRRHNEVLEDCAKKPHEEEAQQFLKHSLLKQRKNGLKPVGCSLEKTAPYPIKFFKEILFQNSLKNFQKLR